MRFLIIIVFTILANQAANAAQNKVDYFDVGHFLDSETSGKASDKVMYMAYIRGIAYGVFALDALQNPKKSDRHFCFPSTMPTGMDLEALVHSEVITMRRRASESDIRKLPIEGVAVAAVIKTYACQTQ